MDFGRRASAHSSRSGPNANTGELAMKKLVLALAAVAAFSAPALAADMAAKAPMRAAPVAMLRHGPVSTSSAVAAMACGKLTPPPCSPGFRPPDVCILCVEQRQGGKGWFGTVGGGFDWQFGGSWVARRIRRRAIRRHPRHDPGSGSVLCWPGKAQDAAGLLAFASAIWWRRTFSPTSMAATPVRNWSGTTLVSTFLRRSVCVRCSTPSASIVTAGSLAAASRTPSISSAGTLQAGS